MNSDREYATNARLKLPAVARDRISYVNLYNDATKFPRKGKV